MRIPFCLGLVRLEAKKASLDILNSLQHSIQVMPIIQAIMASYRTDPSVDESKLPEWAREVIAKAHRPPLVDLSKVFPDSTKSEQVEAPVELSKKDKALV